MCQNRGIQRMCRALPWQHVCSRHPPTCVKCAPIECLLQPLHIRLHKLYPVPQAQLRCTAPRLAQHAAAEVDGGERGQGRGIVKWQVEPRAHRRLQHVAVRQRQQLLPQRREA